MKSLAFLFSLLAPLALAPVAYAQTVNDGDTIKLNGTTYRLWGIDAAEKHQACADGWPAGVEASKALLEMMRGRTITCEPLTKDRYGRTVALCRADGEDLGTAMVRAGMAWSFSRYSSDYAGAEWAAMGARAGVHRHDCIPPWEWRARRLGDR
jgi:endonuclease YncB( thermonuclease family)